MLVYHAATEFLEHQKRTQQCRRRLAVQRLCTEDLYLYAQCTSSAAQLEALQCSLLASSITFPSGFISHTVQSLLSAPDTGHSDLYHTCNLVTLYINQILASGHSNPLNESNTNTPLSAFSNVLDFYFIDTPFCVAGCGAVISDCGCQDGICSR